MSLITADFDRALSYAYNKAAEHGIPMEIYSRPLDTGEIDYDTAVCPLQFIATPNISDEIPDHWTLQVVIGIAA